MTLMPVSNISAFGSSWSNGGASRWISQRSSMSVSWSSVDVERLADHVEHVTEHAVADRHRDAVPGLRTTVPRRRPSVGFRQMARQRPSPICCATSAVIVIVSPSSSMSISSAWLISGSASGGNSTSTTGPAIATTRPSLSSVGGWLSARQWQSWLVLLVSSWTEASERVVVDRARGARRPSACGAPRRRRRSP